MHYHNFYIEKLYPLQDRFLAFMREFDPGNFYLTGGTALSRFYFKHRYSDDLDFFSCGEMPDFRMVVGKLFESARKQGFQYEVETVSDDFFRVFVNRQDVVLKIDLVNDLPARWGEVLDFPEYARVDNVTNILANKLCCIDRYEVKDVADIWMAARLTALNWRNIFEIANTKSPLDPVEIARILKLLPAQELKMVKWSAEPDLQQIHLDLARLSDDILLGRDNSLYSGR